MGKMESLKNCTLSGIAVEDYTSDGLGVAHYEGRAVFVAGAARGDVCDLKIVKDTGGVLYGIIESLTEPSEHRASPGCPVYGPCGGCAFRHVTYEEELRAKLGRVSQTLRRIGGVELPVEEIIGAPSRDGWRNKASFPVEWQGKKPVTGFYRRRSHDICETDSCPMCTAEQNGAAAVLRAWLLQTGRRDVRHLFVRQGEGGVQVCVVSTAKPGPEAATLAGMLKEKIPTLSGVLWDRHHGRGNVILSGNIKTIWGQSRLKDRLCGLDVSLSPMSFYQIHKTQAEKLYACAMEFAGGFSEGADLYCGTGTLTLMLARRGGHVTGVEIVPEAVRDAREAAERGGVTNADFICADAADPGVGLSPDLVMVDPPRKGLEGAAVKAVLDMAPQKIVYISCDPATLARDAGLLRGGGYEVRRLKAFDLFPGTAHVECVALLTK